MNSHNQFQDLVQAYIEGHASPVQMDQLNQLLRDDSVFREQFIELMNLNSGITALVASNDVSDFSQNDILHVPATKHRFRTALPAALTLVLILAVATWWLTVPASFATVKSAAGVVEMEGRTELRHEWHEIESGALELVTARGAHLVIEAPARFRFESAQRLHLTRGRIAADVPPSAKRFTVVTPTGRVVDLGTKFGVDVPVDGEAEVHVFQGEVIAQSSAGGKRQNLYDGDAFRLQVGAGIPRELRSAAFIRPDEVGALHAALRAGQPVQAEIARQKLRSDPSLIALLDFEGNHGLPGQYNMVQGRWPGSQAPEFLNPGDHIQFNVGEGRNWHQITLAAWVRLDRFGEPYQSLLHTDGWGDASKSGQLHWMVTNDRTTRLALYGNELPKESRGSSYYPDSVTPIPNGERRWVHVAAVYDSDKSTVRFYLDGKFDNELQQSVSYPALLGPAQIGNWNLQERKLSGRIDELVLLGRAMGDEEIQQLYDAGNPYR